jgi:hypothetical protein
MYKTLAESGLAAAKAGYSGFRISGEMSWALSDLPGTERLIEYEANVNKYLRTYAVESPIK